MRGLTLLSALALLSLTACHRGGGRYLDYRDLSLSSNRSAPWKTDLTDLKNLKECVKPDDTKCYCMAEPGDPIKVDFLGEEKGHLKLKLKWVPTSSPCLRQRVKETMYVSGQDFGIDTGTLRNGGYAIEAKKLTFLKSTPAQLTAYLSDKEKCAVPQGTKLYLASRPGEAAELHRQVTLHPRMFEALKCAASTFQWWIVPEDFGLN